MTTTSEAWHAVDDGTKLFTKTWKPSEQASKGKIVFLHGYNHNSDTSATYFEHLNSRGIEVLSYDQRGFGRSVTTPSTYGLSGSTAIIHSDLTSILLTVLPSPIPIFLYGHSMGGAIMFSYACTGPSSILSQIRGLIGEAPDFGLPAGAVTEPGWFTRRALKVFDYCHLLPGLQVTSKLRTEDLSADATVRERLEKDPLMRSLVTLQGAAGHFQRTDSLSSGKMKLSEQVKSVWIGHGTEDRCTSFEESKKWIEGLKLQDKTFVAYEGALHDLHMEQKSIRDNFYRDAADFILTRCAREG